VNLAGKSLQYASASGTGNFGGNPIVTQVSASTATGNYPVWVRFSNSDATPQTATCTIAVNVATPAAASKIHDIQGSAHISPLNGQPVIGVPRIVTALKSNGFYMQDPNPDANDATSEGIFVYRRSIRIRFSGAVRGEGTIPFDPFPNDSGRERLDRDPSRWERPQFGEQARRVSRVVEQVMMESNRDSNLEHEAKAACMDSFPNAREMPPCC
jgi:hypothetical protein